MRHRSTLAILLVVFWLVNSGLFKPHILALGVASIALVVVMSMRMKLIDRESQPMHLFPHIFGYWAWLAREIITANIDVSRRIWLGPKSIEPTRLYLETSSHTDLGKALFANSVTLTPGTVTLEISGKKVVIHALSQGSTSGLASIDRRVSKVE